MLHSKLILGTAQFGLNYGVNNSYGRPSQKEIFSILDFARLQGIEMLDTADAYGNAIEIIGLYHQKRSHRFRILNKFKIQKRKEIIKHANNTLNQLCISHFDVYSYHSFDDYINFPHLKEDLLILKDQKLISKIGISVYTNYELMHVIDDNDIEVIQLPYNLLDNQNIRGEYLNYAKKNGKEIHIRSVFLQGLFFMDEQLMPEKLFPLKAYLTTIKDYCRKESINIGSLAISYPIYKNNIDSVLIGVDSKDHLRNNIESIIDLKNAFDYIDNWIKVQEIELLYPFNWK
jgi:aryl-alcohol dehydrogenase-like predicted oxidoreductase